MGGVSRMTVARPGSRPQTGTYAGRGRGVSASRGDRTRSGGPLSGVAAHRWDQSGLSGERVCAALARGLAGCRRPAPEAGSPLERPGTGSASRKRVMAPAGVGQSAQAVTGVAMGDHEQNAHVQLLFPRRTMRTTQAASASAVNDMAAGNTIRPASSGGAPRLRAARPRRPSGWTLAGDAGLRDRSRAKWATASRVSSARTSREPSSRRYGSGPLPSRAPDAHPASSCALP